MHSPDIRICFVGDSYVNGTGDDDCLGWTGRLCVAARHAGHRVTYYNLGVRRETSADIARRWEMECSPRFLSTSENYVVFSLGANDVSEVNGKQRLRPDETIAHYRSILETARARYHTLVVGPPPAGDREHDARLARLSEQMHEIAMALHVPFIPTLPDLVDDHSWIEEVQGHDGSHPRAKGYARLAGIVGASEHWWFGPVRID